MRTRIPPGPKEDEEKTTFYTNHGTYCYVKIPFDLKNVGATYERLVDSAFQTQLGRNLEAGGEVPRKTKKIIGGLRRRNAHCAFQELKKLVLELPTLTTPEQRKTLFVYLATSRDAVSGVLVADRKGKQTPIRYVSRTLHEAERNYAPLEKLALCLLHLSRRLCRYFEAHPIKVIMDQPVKQILNKLEASGKLAKYVVELGAYNITYIPRTAVKGQMLADFINEVPVGTRHVEVCSLVREGDLVRSTASRTEDSPEDEGAGIRCEIGFKVSSMPN
ncbi:reverse transcriptase domain-containing protein [Tanacetum coccineum]